MRDFDRLDTASARLLKLRAHCRESHVRVQSLSPSSRERRWHPGSAQTVRVSPMSSKVVCMCALVAALSIPTELGVAEGAPAGHSGPWPIHNGLDHQPTQDELRALHQQDVTSDQANEIDRLYDELLSTTKQILGQRPAPAP